MLTDCSLVRFVLDSTTTLHIISTTFTTFSYLYYYILSYHRVSLTICDDIFLPEVLLVFLCCQTLGCCMNLKLIMGIPGDVGRCSWTRCYIFHLISTWRPLPKLSQPAQLWVGQVFITIALRDTSKLGETPLIPPLHSQLHPSLISKSLLSHMDEVIDSSDWKATWPPEFSACVSEIKHERLFC